MAFIELDEMIHASRVKFMPASVQILYFMTSAPA
jgi:hypothetical protein